MQTEHGTDQEYAMSMRILHRLELLCSSTLHKTLVLRIVDETNFHGPLWCYAMATQDARLCIEKRIKTGENVYYADENGG